MNGFDYITPTGVSAEEHQRRKQMFNALWSWERSAEGQEWFDHQLGSLGYLGSEERRQLHGLLLSFALEYARRDGIEDNADCIQRAAELVARLRDEPAT